MIGFVHDEAEECIPGLTRRANVQEAAAFLRLSPNALNWYRSQRRGPTYPRIGPKTIRYRVGDLRAYMVEVQPLSCSYESRTAQRISR
ncbi:MAG: hypothetical protein LBP86_07965 [Azoarcus sp.]|nr:hypothetical protein [Azoarcus sp.]